MDVSLHSRILHCNRLSLLRIFLSDAAALAVYSFTVMQKPNLYSIISFYSLDCYFSPRSSWGRGSADHEMAAGGHRPHRGRVQRRQTQLAPRAVTHKLTPAPANRQFSQRDRIGKIYRSNRKDPLASSVKETVVAVI